MTNQDANNMEQEVIMEDEFNQDLPEVAATTPKKKKAKSKAKAKTGKTEAQKAADKAKAEKAKADKKAKAEKAKADQKAKEEKLKADKEAKEEAERAKRGTSKTTIALFEKANVVVAQQDAAQKVVQILENIKDFSDEQVRATYLAATEGSKVTFVALGGIAYEIYRRVRDEKGFRTGQGSEGQGANKVFADLANEIGVDVQTLYSDFRIYDKFGEYLVGLLQENPSLILPREYYSIAAKAGEKYLDLLTYFEEQREAVAYNVQHARRDASRLKEGMTLADIRKADAKERKENAGKPSTEDSKTPEELISGATLPLRISKTAANESYLADIVAKYDSFEKWFVLRASEEFDEAARPAVR